MMRLLFLCVLLLLPAATVLSEEFEGSAEESDDEDLGRNDIQDVISSRAGSQGTENDSNHPNVEGSQAGNEDAKDESSHMTLIIIAAVVAVVALSVITVAAVMFIKRQKLKQQQGIYSVPIEQNKKEAI